MEINEIVLLIGLMITLGAIAEFFFKKKGVPAVLWLLIFGFILNILGVFDTLIIESLGPLISATAIIFIMFDGGMHFDIGKIIDSAKDGITLMFLSFIITGTIIVSIIYILGGYIGLNNPLMYGLLLATMLGGTSASVIIPIMKNITNFSSKAKHILIVESLADSFVFIFVFFILGFYSISETSYGIGYVISNTISGIIIGIALGGLILIIIKKLNTHAIIYTLILGLLFITYTLTTYSEGSAVLSMFFAGLVIGNSKYIQKKKDIPYIKQIKDISIRNHHSLITFFIKVFFFIYLGLIFKFDNHTGIILGIIATLVLLISKKLSVMLYLNKNKDYTKTDLNIITITIPRGLSNAVLALIPLTYGLQNGDLFPSIIGTVIFLSVIITSVGYKYLTKNNEENPNTS